MLAECSFITRAPRNRLECFHIVNRSLGVFRAAGHDVHDRIARALPLLVGCFRGWQHKQSEFGEICRIQNLLKQTLQTPAHRIARRARLFDLSPDLRRCHHQRAHLRTTVRPTSLTGSRQHHPRPRKGKIAEQTLVSAHVGRQIRELILQRITLLRFNHLKALHQFAKLLTAGLKFFVRIAIALAARFDADRLECSRVVDPESRLAHRKLRAEKNVEQPRGWLHPVFLAFGISKFHRARTVDAQHRESGISAKRLDTPAILQRQCLNLTQGLLRPRDIALDAAQSAFRHHVDKHVVKCGAHSDRNDHCRDAAPCTRWLVRHDSSCGWWFRGR